MFVPSLCANRHFASVLTIPSPEHAVADQKARVGGWTIGDKIRLRSNQARKVDGFKRDFYLLNIFLLFSLSF